MRMAVDLLEQAGALPDGLPLWRYMKLSTLLLLLEGTTFFPSVATLRASDPLEGSLHPEVAWLSSALSKLHGQPAADELDSWLLDNVEEWVRKYQERNKENPDLNTPFFADLYVSQLAKRRAVWCWFASDIESAAMWSVYGHGGVAVGTTMGAMKSVLPSKRRFQISRIRYADRDCSSLDRFNPEATSDAVYIHRPHFVKGREYEHEREVRVATLCHGQEKGATIRGIVADEFIREIVLSPLWPHVEAKAVASFLKKQPWKTPPLIRSSTLLGSLPDEEEIHERLDAFFNDSGETEDNLPILMREL
jgi:hypothetical protein